MSGGIAAVTSLAPEARIGVGAGVFVVVVRPTKVSRPSEEDAAQRQTRNGTLPSLD
jgi:hypothetical protein